MSPARKLSTLGAVGFLFVNFLKGPTVIAESFLPHTVVQGETLWGISRQYEVELDQLVKENKRDKDGILSIGEVLIIPGKQKKIEEISRPDELTDYQFEVLCAVVQQEAGYDYQSALWVMTTILNRVDAGGSFGADICSVISMPGQFESYGEEHYLRHIGGITEDTQQAISDAFSGIRPHDYLFFWTSSYAENLGRQGIDVGGNRYFSQY